VQLTRRARGLPLWFSLATFGAQAYRDAISASIELAHAVSAEITQRDYVSLVREPQLSVVVFERVGWKPGDYAHWSNRLLDEQHAFVVPSSHAGRTNARFAIVNPRTTLDDLTSILDSMQ
jgi:glutamate/tyrosine decarboxylase-like PLP-dependent enzyme